MCTCVEQTHASLVSTMDSILGEQRNGDSMESILAKRKEESTSRSPVRRKQTSDKESRENDQPSKKRKLNESKTSTSISTNSGLVEVNICTGTESPSQDMYTAEKNNVHEIQGTDIQKEAKDKACPPQKIAEIFKTPKKMKLSTIKIV
ncbi:uncharacterized protein [Argopecten irradians]|uniref:uncharacterized protein isoform X2 n=1 Tax=Argopecten irradians TaxID=31199 RepID=UPI0037104315